MSKYSKLDFFVTTSAAMDKSSKSASPYVPQFDRPPSLSVASSGGLYAQDPRSSSTQSLVPSQSESEVPGRRRLLVIYIHGFMGNDASFQSFPAHVHRFLKLALADSHVIHSKIYPRYKTYKAIEVARDNFSRWLAPHESPNTDVILVGHSMGGLLAADIVLMPGNLHHHGYFRHRILGTVNLDAPFLGLHPGIIPAGISSLFRPKSDTPEPPEAPIPQDESSPSSPGIASANSSMYSDPSAASFMSQPSPTPLGAGRFPAMTFDPNFNPSFPNDVPIRDRGWWKNVVHFVQKHNSEGLVDAFTNHIMSYLEFGSCLLDTNCLKSRYANFRKLEDIDDLKNHGFHHVPPRVRFIQYYTVCNGYPKKPKHKKSNQNLEATNAPRSIPSDPLTPTISIQDHNNLPSPQGSLDSVSREDGPPLDTTRSNQSSLEILSPDPIPEDQTNPKSNVQGQQLETTDDIGLQTNIKSTALPSNNNSPTADVKTEEAPLPQMSSNIDSAETAELTSAVESLDLDLPTIPKLPVKPHPPNLDQYGDKSARKQAEKESKQAQKAYEQLVKNRDKVIKERQKIVDKRKKKAAQEKEKLEKESQKRRRKEKAAVENSSSSKEEAPKEPINPAAREQDSTTNSGASQADSNSGVKRPEPNPLQKPQDNIKPPKKQKEYKFCNLPHKVNGEVDPKWVKIFMKDIDQVGAHTSLFFDGEHYEKLIGDVGQTVVGWVQEDLTKRAVLEMEYK
ncbi:hypothetical protein F4779DRAFT_600645 [Xylariaceae sp. FL0662B]|nr:hypothetical protein F4779DRAFT_600645 [Xylariaceae sp. FL0662B]